MSANPDKSLAQLLPTLNGDEIVGMAQSGSLAWKSSIAGRYNDVTQLLSSSPDEASKRITAALKFQNCDRDIRQAVIRDYFLGVIWFAQQKKLTAQSTSALMHVMGTLMENCKSNMSLAQNVQEFQNIMSTRSSIDSEYDTNGKVFDFPAGTVTSVVNFVKTSIFQHYRMYRRLYSMKRSTAVQLIEHGVTVPIPVAPLDEAVTQSQWDHHHGTSLTEDDSKGQSDSLSETETKNDKLSPETGLSMSETEANDIVEFVLAHHEEAITDELKAKIKAVAKAAVAETSDS